MSIKKIVLAYDGSDGSKFALEWTKDNAKQLSAEVIIASVYQPILSLQVENGDLLIDYTQAYKKGLNGLLDEAVNIFTQEKITATAVLLDGNPADEIINCAIDNEADLIVCGTRGLGGFASLMLGSVAHKLVTYSPVPVLVVKNCQIKNTTAKTEIPS